MAENYSAQNSITIKRLRSNDSLMLTFENNGIPLFQAVDEESGAVSPDWSIAANQPVRTPKVTSARGLAVSLSGHSWAYNGVALNFNGAESGGCMTVYVYLRVGHKLLKFIVGSNLTQEPVIDTAAFQ